MVYPTDCRIVLVRHGNTDKKEDDRERTLTDLGRKQVRLMANKLADFKFDIAFISPTPRAVETFQIIETANSSVAETRIIDELYTPEGELGERIMAMYSEIGHQPLTIYAQHKNRAALDEFACYGEEKIRNGICETFGAHSGLDILVVGHGVYQPAIAQKIVCRLTDAENPGEKIGDMILGEGEAIVIYHHHGAVKVTHWTLP